MFESVKSPHEIGREYLFVTVYVAGVTYKNGRRHRQTILRKIFWKDEPYQRIDENNCIELVTTEYNGEPAVEVWVKNKKAKEQIGYVPKEDASFFTENMYRLDGCVSFEVYGGGKREDGERNYFGASFRARFKLTDEEKAQNNRLDEPDKIVLMAQRALDMGKTKTKQAENKSVEIQNNHNRKGKFSPVLLIVAVIFLIYLILQIK